MKYDILKARIICAVGHFDNTGHIDGGFTRHLKCFFLLYLYRILIISTMGRRFTCSCKHSKLRHFASQNFISTIGPGLSARRLSLSKLSTSSTLDHQTVWGVLLNYVNLVSPFDNDSLDIGLQNHIEMFPSIFSNSPFLIFNIIKALQGGFQYRNLV